MKRKLVLLLGFKTLFPLLLFGQNINHVILISIDGLHPDMYKNNDWPTQNLQHLMKRGTYADHLLSVFPAYTYPSHAAMLTGALPARSKVVYNQPIGSKGEWNWEAKYIKATSIWSILNKTGLKTAAIMWPGCVGAEIDYNLSEIWDINRPDDRATVVRSNATPKGIYEEIEKEATGKLDSINMNDNYFSLDENTGRMASYIFKKYKPNFMAVHLACVDGMEHEYGRDADSVRLAIEADDRAIGDVMQAIQQSGLKDSTAVIIVGDHGFSTIHQVMRPNMLIKSIPARFIAAGGSCFLYPTAKEGVQNKTVIITAVTDSLNKLPADKRKLFRIIDREELDKMGADSAAILALTAVPGTVFSGAVQSAKTLNRGPGTLIQQSKFEGLFIPTTGGHHGYDPSIPDMWTGFIAYGTGIIKGGHIKELCVTDIAPLIANLLGVEFHTPDGKIIPGILNQ